MQKQDDKIDLTAYGFSWEDVDLLRGLADRYTDKANHNAQTAERLKGHADEWGVRDLVVRQEDAAARLNDLCARIYALLPPQDTTGARE